MALAIYYDFDSSLFQNFQNDAETKKTPFNLFHPLICELLEQDNNLKDYLYNDETKEKYFLSQNNDQVIQQVILFNRKTLFKILFIHKVRFSYSNRKHMPVLYEINFSNDLLHHHPSPPDIIAYHKNIETNQLEAIPFSKLNSKMKWCGSFYSGLKDTPLEIRLKLIALSFQTIVQIENHQKSILLTFPSSVIVQDPFNRLSAFFELLTFPSITPRLQDFILQQTREALNEILRNESSRKRAIEFYSSNPKAIQALLIYRASALGEEEDKKILCLVEEIFLNKQSLELMPFTSKPISPIAAHEHLEKKIKTKGGIWPCRIPALLSALADKFSCEFGLATPNDILTETFCELDLDPTQVVMNPKTGEIDYNKSELIPVSRPLGQHEAGVIIGLWTANLHTNVSMTILLIIGDITAGRSGGITSQECARINAAIRYAGRHHLPIDWFSSSHGVAIKLDKGVENLDASSATAREIVNQCHHKGIQINLLINETNIGAQSYWNALATILLDTTGILIMTSRGSMALTGPISLVSALYSRMHSLDLPQATKEFYPEGLQSLSGYELIHGPNSDAMAYADSLEEACELLIRHHFYTYKKPNEPLVSQRSHLKKTGENKIDHRDWQKEIKKLLNGEKSNREKILEALRDPNSPLPVRFWSDAKGTRGQSLKRGDLLQEPTTIVQEMFIGSLPTLVIFTPTGPMTPADADIISRAIFKANRCMPVLIIGSLSGFSSDPLSMENRQLLYGASIIKAIVDHQGPILVANLSKLVGGTFVIFSKQLNPNLRILAIEGSSVRVIGGKTAAKVIFRSRIYSEAEENPEVKRIAALLASCTSPRHKIELKNAYKKIFRHIVSELEAKEGELFDQIHSVERALKVGAIDEIVPLDRLFESIQRNLHELVSKYKRDQKDLKM